MPEPRAAHEALESITKIRVARWLDLRIAQPPIATDPVREAVMLATYGLSWRWAENL